MARRYYSSTAARTTLASGVDDSTTTFSVTAVSGWPASYPYTLVIDQDTVNEELVEVSARSGTTLTVTRGVDGTSAVAHDSGAAVNHGVSARDFDEPNAFINGTGTVTETLLASGAVTEAKLGTGAVTSAKILDGTIVNADINASAAIAQSKVADLTSDLASKLPYSYGTATPSTTDSGFLWYDSNSTPAAPKFWDGSTFQSLGGGKILQVVSATKTDTFSTSASSYTDITGMSVSITPSAATSKILVYLIVNVSVDTDGVQHFVQLVRDSTPISIGDAYSSTTRSSAGDVRGEASVGNNLTVIHLDSPATTSATTYKAQGFANSTNVFYLNRGRVLGSTAVYQRTASSITVMEISA